MRIKTRPIDDVIDRALTFANAFHAQYRHDLLHGTNYATWEVIEFLKNIFDCYVTEDGETIFMEVP